MEELLKALYLRSLELNMDYVEREALGGLSSGYLSTYRLGLLFPWTLEGVTDLVPVHGRIKAIGWRLEMLSRDGDVPVAERVGHVADLFGCYVMGTDSGLVSRGLEAAWGLLHGRGEERMTLPCRTAGMCRLLCHCHYFTNDENCLKLAEGLVTETVGRDGALTGRELLAWRDALELYANVTDGVEGLSERERLEGTLRRFDARAGRVEDEIIASAKRGGGMDDAVAFSLVFAVVARRVLNESIVAEGKSI